MNVLQELEDFIKEFNQKNDVDFEIDSIRVEFSKQHKLEKLQEVGDWKKLQKNSNILHKLKKRLTETEVTSAYRLENYNIYMYYKKDPTGKSRKAEMVIFGMKQYDREPLPKELVAKILSILKDVSNIDVSIDFPYKPNMKALGNYFYLDPYITKNGKVTETRYINNTSYPMIEKVIIYDKAFKNKLEGILWRIEAKMIIPNIKELALPLFEFKEIIDIARIGND